MDFIDIDELRKKTVENKLIQDKINLELQRDIVEKYFEKVKEAIMNTSSRGLFSVCFIFDDVKLYNPDVSLKEVSNDIFNHLKTCGFTNLEQKYSPYFGYTISISWQRNIL